MRALDLRGRRFGRLVAIEPAGTNETPSGRTYAMWRCVCDCGRTVRVGASHLNTGQIRSCGCLQRETVTTRNLRHGSSPRGKRRREYRIWMGMKSRCLNPKATHFELYGGRGITICDQWKTDFAAFLSDMGPCPTGYEIDRIDPDGPYAPENCRWASRTTQTNNSRRNRFVVFRGAHMTLAEAARAAAIPYKALEAGLRNGRRIDDVVASYRPRRRLRDDPQ